MSGLPNPMTSNSETAFIVFSDTSFLPPQSFTSMRTVLETSVKALLYSKFIEQMISILGLFASVPIRPHSNT